MNPSAKTSVCRRLALIAAACMPIVACGSSEVTQRAVGQEDEPVVGGRGHRCHPHSKARHCRLDGGSDATADASEDSGIEDSGMVDTGMEASNDSSVDASVDAGDDGGNGCLTAGVFPFTLSGVRCQTIASDTPS